MNRFISTIFIIFFLGAAPHTAHSQSIGDLLKFIPKGSSSNNIADTIKSLSEINFGQVEPGAAPDNPGEQIILYRTAWCPQSKRAASYLRKKNISFVERDIEKNSTYNKEFFRLGGKGVPFFVLREKTISGFDEATFDRYYAEFKNSASGPATVAPPNLNGTSGNSGFQSGDVLIGKIGGVNIYLQPTKPEKLTVLSKSEEMIYMGELRDGYYRVTTQKGEGWVDRLLVKKQ